MRLERLKQQRVVFESERPQRIAKLLESAKSQTETPEYKMETRLVEFVEKFYPQYCGVKLTREQVNEIRLNWKQINCTKSNRDEFYDSPLYKVTFDYLATRGEESMCEDCHTALWNEIEGLDFYLLEAINGVNVIGTRFANGKDATISIDYRNNFSATEYCSCGVACDFDKRPIVLVTPNPEIVDKLSEPLRAQKYMSEPIDKEPMKLSWKVRILSNGYGKDSITEVALNHAYYDEIVFSDTGSEQPETYAYIKYLSMKLPSVARNKIRIVHSRYGVIYDYYFNKKAQPIPARRDCTGKFKVEPMKQVLTKVYGINPMGFKREIIEVKDGKRTYDHKIEMSIGINYSEPDRMNGGGVWYMKNRYPLVEKKVEKKDEKGILEALGYVVPVKSGCFFCPYGTQPYWKGLKRDHPELYEKAKAMQDNSTLRQKFIKFKDTDKTDVELSCSCFNGNWESEEELETKNNWSF